MSIPNLGTTIRFATTACGDSVGAGGVWDAVGEPAAFGRPAEGVAREEGAMDGLDGVAIDGEPVADAVYNQLSWVPSSKATTATTPIAARMCAGWTRRRWRLWRRRVPWAGGVDASGPTSDAPEPAGGRLSSS
jgi:hypothetical protein